MTTFGGSFNYLRGSGDRNFPQFIGDQTTAVNIVAANGTTPVTILTGNPSYYITRILIKIDVNCTIGTSGINSITVADSGGTTLTSFRPWMPNTFAMPTLTVAPVIQATESGYLFVARAPSTNLTVTLGTALTGTGAIRVAVNYGFTSFIG